MSLTQPLFSVVIPLYNKEACITATINSVLNQTFEDFELLVIDDGSTDKSIEKVKAITDERIKIFSKTNGGVSDARNYGIERAQSEWIALLDADDNWEPSFLKEMDALIKKFPFCGFVAAAYKRIEPRKTTSYGHQLPEGIIDDFFKIKLKQPIPCTSAIVLKKKAIQEVGGFPVGMIGGEDEYTWAKLAIKYQVAFTPKVLSYYNREITNTVVRSGKVDHCKESWLDLYKEGEFYRNEFIAKKAIIAGIRHAYSPHQNKSKEIEKSTRYTVLFKKKWRNLYILNRLPFAGLKWITAMAPHYIKARHWASGMKHSLKTYFQ